MKQTAKTSPQFDISDHAAKKIYKLAEKMALDPRFSLHTKEGQQRYAQWHMKEYGYLPEEKKGGKRELTPIKAVNPAGVIPIALCNGRHERG